MYLKSPFVIVIFSLCTTVWAEPREWNDRKGEFSVVAEFFSFKDDKVYMEKAGGDVISVPIEQLSYADYDYLRTLPEMRDFLRKNPLPTQHTIFQLKFEQGFEAITFSPDGRFVAGATAYGVVMVDLEKETHTLTQVPDKRTSFLKFCKFTPDGKVLVTQSGITNDVTTWQVDSDGRVRHEKTFKLDQRGTIQCMAFHPDGQHVVSGDDLGRALCYWDLNTGEIKYSFEKMFKGDIEGCYINPKGTQAVATDGNFAILFDLQLGKPIQKMPLTDNYVYRTDLSSDGRQAFAEKSGVVYAWTIQDGQRRLPITLTGSRSVWKLVSSADGKFLLIGQTQSVDLWSTVNAQHVHKFFTSGDSSIRIMAISPDCRRIAVASDPGKNVLQIFRNPAVPD